MLRVEERFKLSALTLLGMNFKGDSKGMGTEWEREGVGGMDGDATGMDGATSGMQSHLSEDSPWKLQWWIAAAKWIGIWSWNLEFYLVWNLYLLVRTTFDFCTSSAILWQAADSWKTGIEPRILINLKTHLLSFLSTAAPRCSEGAQGIISLW